jgi:two-component system nitrate/nitrite response regulator NarL
MNRHRTDTLSLVLCDDHLVFLESLELALVARGHQVVAAVSHPRDAVKHVEDVGADVCVMDLSFGGSEALDAIRHLSAMPVRTVVLTGYLDDTVKSRCLDAGADACVGKDWPLPDVLVAIEGASSPHDRASAFHSDAMAANPWSADQLARFLTVREREVLAALVAGETTEELARRLHIRQATVRTHVQSVLNKLGVHSRLEAVSLAVRNSLVAPPPPQRQGPTAV